MFCSCGRVALSALSGDLPSFTAYLSGLMEDGMKRERTLQVVLGVGGFVLFLLGLLLVRGSVALQLA